jgi:D-serine deaminase-like pyridoxal phosphate-dependent protein
MPTPSLIDRFRLEPAGRRLEDLETPVPVIDLDIVERNLVRWQERCDTAGLANRPHIKTHKLVALALHQLALGARGITVQKVGEAEVMAAAGIRDMLLTFNILGRSKLARLARLIADTDIKVVADSEIVVAGLEQAAEAGGRKLGVLIECDTGAGRNGVQTPEAAQVLARRISTSRHLTFDGLMTYPKSGGRRDIEVFFDAAKGLLAADGIEVATLSSGGSPDMWSDEGLAPITEYRAGTYIYNDRALMKCGAAKLADCALSVLATVVSRPREDRAIIDAGSKALTSDLLGLEGYGVVPELNDGIVFNVNEEHGYLDVSRTNHKPKVGDLVRVVPNHVCPVSNLYDRVVLISGGEVLGAVKVDARGTVT